MKRGLLFCGAAFGVLSAAPGIAQTVDETASPAVRDGLQDIIVTAQKRSESLQNVPIAISAYNSESLSEKGADRIADLGRVAPALVVNELAGNTIIYMRGVGGEFLTPSSNPAISTYIDGFVVPYVGGIDRSFIDVERVEIVKGPQGILYGRNATGGAINVITKGPSNRLEGNGVVSFGNYEDVSAQAFVSGPLTDSLGFSIAGGYANRNSYIKNVGPTKIGQNTEYGARGKLRYETPGGVEFELLASYQYHDQPEANAFAQLQQTSAGVVTGGLAVNRPHRVSVTSRLDQNFEEKFVGGRISAPLGGARLVSLTGYREATSSLYLDYDATTSPLVEQEGHNFEDTFTQEFQLLSDNGGPLEWVAGLYYFNSKGGFGEIAVYAGPNRDRVVQFGASARLLSYAAFGQVTYKLTPEFSIIAGARYTRDEAKFYGGRPNLGAAVGARKDSWNDFSPKLTLQYDNGPVMIYATASKGYKGGSYNISVFDADPANNPPVDPERLYSLEAGIKARVSNWAQLEFAAFHYRYDDIQVSFARSVTSPIFYENADRARIQGLEGSGTFQVGSALQVDVSAAWLPTAKYTDYTNGSGFQSIIGGNDVVLLDFSGRRLTRVPKFTANGGAKYTIDLASGAKVDLTGSFSYMGSYFFDAQNLPISRQGSYLLANAGIRYTAANDRMYVELWGRNLGDETYFANKALNTLGQFGTYGAPRTYGITIGANF